jgi:hypothetical protein
MAWCLIGSAKEQLYRIFDIAYYFEHKPRYEEVGYIVFIMISKHISSPPPQACNGSNLS